MKEIVITPQRIRKELLILGGCLCLALGVNIFAIIYYHRPATELFTQAGFMLTLALILYLLLSLVRLIVKAAGNLFRGKKKPRA